MNTLTDTVRREIEDMHVFFTAWFNGTANRSELETRLAARLHPDFIVVSPDGRITAADALKSGFERTFGANPDFRIEIRDVVVRFRQADQVLATYTEWQVGAKNSARSKNARFSSVLLEVGTPILWLHVQETWLPEELQAADPFNF